MHSRAVQPHATPNMVLLFYAALITKLVFCALIGGREKTEIKMVDHIRLSEQVSTTTTFFVVQQQQKRQLPVYIHFVSYIIWQ